MAFRTGVPNSQAAAHYQTMAYSELGQASNLCEEPVGVHTHALTAWLVQVAGWRSHACMHLSTCTSDGPMHVHTCMQLNLNCMCMPTHHLHKLSCVCTGPPVARIWFSSPSWAAKLQWMGIAALEYRSKKGRKCRQLPINLTRFRWLMISL